MRGSVVKRGTSWSLVYRAPDPESGQTKQVWRGGFARKRDAETALREIIGQVDAGTYTKPTRVTLGQYMLEDWLPSLDAAVAGGTLRPTTVAQYRTLATKHVLPRLGGVYLQALSPTHLNRMYGELLTCGRRNGKGGLSRTSVHAIHVTVSRALADAIRWGRLTRNVATLADPPRPDQREMSVWSPGQVRAFLAHVANDRLAAMWVLFATTGMRRGEVAGLAWRDVNLEDGELAVRQARVTVNYRVADSDPKTDKGRRTISLDPATVTALRAHRRRQVEDRLAWSASWTDSGLVFTREDGSAIHPERMTQAFHRHARVAGLPVIRLHDLRHSYATAALEAGEDLKVLSARLGHSSIGITGDTYQHVTRGLDRQAADRVASFILGD
jgi:integrase